MSSKWVFIVVSGLFFSISSALSSSQTGSVDGSSLFTRRCGGCHSLDNEKEGPRLRTVYGRKAGTVPGFLYSDGLKNAQFSWDEQSLNKWLTEPSNVIAGTDMDFRVPDPAERRAIIEYLKQLGNK